MKRYHRDRYSFQSWDIVTRELIEKRDRLQDIDNPANRGLSTTDREAQQTRIRSLTDLIANLREEWSKP